MPRPNCSCIDNNERHTLPNQHIISHPPWVTMALLLVPLGPPITFQSNGLSTVGFRLYASAIQPLMWKKVVGIAQKKLYRHSLEPFFSTLHLHILVE